ncbi:MAG: hypothetical protein ACKO3G_10340, partial [Planctomycetaceae bacterium]
DGAVALVAHPCVEAAVIVSRAADAAAEGLDTLHCEVAVLAPEGADGGVDPATATLLNAIEPDGRCVVDAAAPGAAAILARLGPRAVLVGGPDAGAEAVDRLARHRDQGGFVVVRRGAEVLLA